MENAMKPVRIPKKLTSKKLLVRIFALYLVGFVLFTILTALTLPNSVIVLFGGFWFFSFFAVLCTPLYCDRILFPEGVQVRVFGKVLGQLPAAEMKLLCAVGDDREQYLCLCGWSLEELAQRREESLQRGLLTRQDLPFLKRNPDWQTRFAKEYLLRSGNFSRKTRVLRIPFDPVAAVFLRRLYPQLPCLDLRNSMLSRVGAQAQDRTPFTKERYWIDEKGIHIRGELRNSERRWFPAKEIKTILRIDRFTTLSKSEPAYGIYLVASERTLEELAQKGKRKGRRNWKGKLIDQLQESEEMYAAEFYFSYLFTWNWRTARDCPVWYTPETEALLRKFCPNAQWVDYSHKWRS